MDLLWQKKTNLEIEVGDENSNLFCCCFASTRSEVTKDNGLYVDFFQDIKTKCPDIYKLREKFKDLPSSSLEYKNSTFKSDEFATKLRNEGEDCFENGDWFEAMKLYNLSLRFAEIDSESVALVYGNRALCFLQLKMYDKCLADIDLAKNAKYPQYSMSKLENKRTECVEQMTAGDQFEEFIPKLDFDADENYPGMANVLEIKYNQHFGRHVIAKCDIDVGKIVLLEDAFISQECSLPEQSILMICEYCQKSLMNFIACDTCTYALFCSTNCKQNDKYHKSVCEYKELNLIGNIKNDLQAVYFAVDTFPNVDDLIEFLEDVVKDASTKIPQSLNDAKSKYRAFLQLNKLALSEKDRMEKLLIGAYMVYLNLMARDSIKSKFNTEKKRNFLMHLVLHHRCVIVSSNLTLVDGTFKPVANIFSYFNHSCAPNLLTINSPEYGNRLICVTVRPIKKGEQLYVNYIDTQTRCSDKYLQNIERRCFLHSIFGFECECENCESNSWPRHDNHIKFDSRYNSYRNEVRQLVVRRGQKEDLSYRKDALVLQNKFIGLLTEYGNNEWSWEIETLITNLLALIIL